MANLTKLWSKPNQSTIISERIHDTFEVYLKVPKKHAAIQHLTL